MISQLLTQSSHLLATEPIAERLQIHWNCPLWATLLVAALTIACVFAIYANEITTARRPLRLLLATLRLTALALVIGMIAQPTIESYQVGRPRLIVLVDRSASMATRDVDNFSDKPEALTRFEALKQILTEGDHSLLDVLQEKYQLDVVAFDEQFQHLVAGEPTLVDQLFSLQIADNTSGATRLGDAIDYALRDLPGPPPTAIVLLTDGRATSGQTLQEAARRARELRVPLFTVALGSDRPRPDASIDDFVVEEIVFPGDRLQVEATLRAVGYGGRPARVTLRNSATGQRLAETTATLPVDGATERVQLAVRPNESGSLLLTLTVESIQGEADRENNVVTGTVEVRDQKLRVLLAQSSPSYEYRALKSLLERDPAVRLSAFLQEADADFAEVDATAVRAFPATEKEMLAYDVILLGDLDPGLLPRAAWSALERFVVDHGGGLACIAGPRFMPAAFREIPSMQLLLPLDLQSVDSLRMSTNASQGYPVRPTALGRQTPSLQLGETSTASDAVWQGLPPVVAMLEINDLKLAARVLAVDPTHINRAGDPLPVILRHYVGAGEVLLHATDETWRWRWRSDDRYFARYWGQVVRRLGRGRLSASRTKIELLTDRPSYEPGEVVRLQARLAPANDSRIFVQLQSNLEPPREVALQRRVGRRGIFETSVQQLPAGNYTARIVRPHLDDRAIATTFAIRAPPRELARVATQTKLLRTVAELTGGRAYTAATASRLLDELPTPHELSVDAQPLRPLWNNPLTIAMFVFVLTAEWLLRRRYGML